MSEPQEDVLHKLDALLKKHTPAEQDIPVLTDLVEQPRVDLDSIPVLTEEIPLDLSPNFQHESFPATSTIAPELAEPMVPPAATPGDMEQPDRETNAPGEDVLSLEEHNAVLARLEEVENEVEAEIQARISRVQKEEILASEFHAQPSSPVVEVIAPDLNLPLVSQATNQTPLHAATTFDHNQQEALFQEISARLETDVARIVEQHIQQTLANALPGLLNNAMDKALSSMIEQYMVSIEEVVRHTIADELKKQLAPFKRPAPGSKS